MYDIQEKVEARWEQIQAVQEELKIKMNDIQENMRIQEKGVDAKIVKVKSKIHHRIDKVEEEMGEISRTCVDNKTGLKAKISSGWAELKKKYVGYIYSVDVNLCWKYLPTN